MHALAAAPSCPSSTLSGVRPPEPCALRCRSLAFPIIAFGALLPPPRGWRLRGLTVRMAPEEEKMTRRSPLDFPIEWERPKPGRRPDIFPQFSPMKTPLPTPMPADPPDEDEEEEEEKKEEEEEDPEKEEPEKPEQSKMQQHKTGWW
ncbi:actin-binding protein-like [Dioscorea cayenensis subsp. rotundata]|uniref:Actin-binding protein-like n=1 Tax=Dioscorea cayennensis subsp. rotundata TaxID=55577 RepID=A0AB40BYT9_DIOCR|nr:actin-binding protein-like [Dioscorea cayenensis subsp. rotundata]